MDSCVPLITLMRWLAIGGARVWKPTKSPPLSGQTLSFGATGAVLGTLAAAPIAWLAISAPRGSRAHLRDQLHDQRSARHCRGACSGDDHDTFCSPLYQTVTTVLLAYVMMFLPRALISLRASLAQAPVELEEVARSLGRSPARALWGGTLRLAAPGAAAGAAMVFLGVVNELTATLLLAPNGTETLATSFWALSGKLDYAAAAPYATIMVALSLPLTWLPLSPIAAPGRAVSVLELSKVSKFYGSVRAAEDVDLIVTTGSRAAIVGPSGSGKTTLLRLIAGFEQPSAGRILLDGQMIANETGGVPAHLRRVGYLPQDGLLFPHLSVAGNIGFGVEARSAQRSKRVAELMEMVALDPAIGSRSPHELSGGQ
jgi:ABC-type multidrug transport system fused ATPase/permease subunit